MRKLLSIVILCTTMLHGYALAAPPDKKAKAVAGDHKKAASDSKLPDNKKAAGKNKKSDDNEAADDSGSDDKEAISDALSDNNDTAQKDNKLPPDIEVPSDARIRWMLYDESDVYNITTRYGYQTNIVFAPHEEIETISVGDHSMWQIIPSANRIFIRPMEEDATTNMTVLTDKHSYQFDLKSVAPDKTKGNIYVAKFIYADDKTKTKPGLAMPVADMPPSMPPGPVAPATAPFVPSPSVPIAPAIVQNQAMPPAQTVSQLPPPVAPLIPTGPIATQPLYPNYNYTYAGPDDLAPLQVYDDGKSTYLKYRDINQPLPNVFVVDSAGKESPVTYNVKGDFVVIDAVAGEMSLKNSDGTVHIYNEMLNPG